MYGKYINHGTDEAGSTRSIDMPSSIVRKITTQAPPSSSSSRPLGSVRDCDPPGALAPLDHLTELDLVSASCD